MYFLKKLFLFNVHKQMLCAFIETVMRFGLICLYGNASEPEAQKKLLRKEVTQIAGIVSLDV